MQRALRCAQQSLERWRLRAQWRSLRHAVHREGADRKAMQHCRTRRALQHWAHWTCGRAPATLVRMRQIACVRACVRTWLRVTAALNHREQRSGLATVHRLRHAFGGWRLFWQNGAGYASPQWATMHSQALCLRRWRRRALASLGLRTTAASWPRAGCRLRHHCMQWLRVTVHRRWELTARAAADVAAKKARLDRAWPCFSREAQTRRRVERLRRGRSSRTQLVDTLCGWRRRAVAHWETERLQEVGRRAHLAAGTGGPR
jgi:hypothetical protein